MSYSRGLITPLIATHEPPSTGDPRGFHDSGHPVLRPGGFGEEH